MAVIAICPQNSIFWENQILDSGFASRFPGGNWIDDLSEIVRGTSHDIMTGDRAAALIRQGAVDPADVVVYQEEDSALGIDLIALGARPRVLISLESPLFAGRFYNRLESLSSGFQHAILFNGAHKWVARGVCIHPAHFPSFDAQALPDPVEDPPGRIALVSANKYWKRVGWRPRAIAGRVRDWRRGPQYTGEAHQIQLHDYRLDFIEHFGARGLDLFGPGWSRLTNVPRARRPRLVDTASRAYAVPYQEKLEKLARYRFVACIENAVFPGYVTEKVIDALVAGTIPLYLGAPDVEDFLPPGVFIDLRNFHSMVELDEFLESMDSETWSSYRSAGRDFLSSRAGARFEDHHFAQEVLELLVGGDA